MFIRLNMSNSVIFIHFLDRNHGKIQHFFLFEQQFLPRFVLLRVSNINLN